MNRKAKRNKYKNLQRKYKQIIEAERLRIFAEGFQKSKEKPIQIFSVEIPDSLFLDGKRSYSLEEITSIQKRIAIRKFSELLLENFELFEIVSNEIEMRYNLYVVNMGV